jgi:hypothetical protein
MIGRGMRADLTSHCQLYGETFATGSGKESLVQ